MSDSRHLAAILAALKADPQVVVPHPCEVFAAVPPTDVREAQREAERRVEQTPRRPAPHL